MNDPQAPEAPQGQHDQRPQGPQKKKGLSGCFIALLVFAGVVLVGGIIFVVVLAKALSTPEGQKLMKAVGDTAKLMEEAQNAPGAKEVRKKGGCQQALVIDVQRMGELVDEFKADAGAKDGMGHLKEKVMVTCQVGFARTPPACDDLAKTYVDAAHPTEPFRIMVQKQGGDPPQHCSVLYDASGNPSSENE